MSNPSVTVLPPTHMNTGMVTVNLTVGEASLIRTLVEDGLQKGMGEDSEGVTGEAESILDKLPEHAELVDP